MTNHEQHSKDTTSNSGIWKTNHTTGKAFRPGRKRVRNLQGRRLPSRFRSDLHAKVGRRISAKKSLAFNRRGRRLLRFYKHTMFLYTLHARELGASDEQAAWMENSANYDRLEVIETWLRLLDAAFPGMPYKWALHIGECGRVHAHVAGGQLHNIPNISPNPAKRKLIENTLFDYVRVFGYLTVKNEPTNEQLVGYRKAVNRAGGARRLPRHSGFRGFETPKRVVKASKNPVLDIVCRKFNINNSPANTPPAISLERFESWLSGAFGAFSVAVTTLDKPRQGKHHDVT